MGLFDRFAKPSGNPYSGLDADDLKRQCDAMLRAGDFCGARPIANELVNRDPADGYYWQMKAHAYGNGDDPDYVTAYESIAQALQNADCLYAYGMFLSNQIEYVYQLGDYESVEDGCRQWWDGYTKGNFEKDDWAVMNYALTLRRLGKFDEGIAVLSAYEPANDDGTLQLLKDELIARVSVEDSKFI